MAKGFKHGAGGVPLNFKVVGNPQPQSPKENTLWVDTDVPISGWIFSSTEPGEEVTGSNIYTSSGASSNTAFDGEGNAVSYSGWVVTKYISLPDKTRKLKCTFPFSEMDYFEVYNAEKEILAIICYEAGTWDYQIPSGAKYLRISHKNESTKPKVYAVYLVNNNPDGLVWFPTGTSSPGTFNALKKNSILVDPLSAKQCVNSAWVKKEAKLYRSGQWVDLIRYLYAKGDEYSDITGGWNLTFTPPSQYWSIGNYAKNKDSIYMATGSRQGVRAVTKFKIDVTDLSTISVRVEHCDIQGGDCKLGLTNNADGEGQIAYTLVDGAGIFSLDVSRMTGSYYVSVNATSDANKSTDIRFSEVIAQ